MPQPTKKTLTADTSAQKYFSCPRPNGCRRSGPRLSRTSPTFSSIWLPTSAKEWIVSANSVGDPVTSQPKPFANAMAEFVATEMETDEDIGSGRGHRKRRTWEERALASARTQIRKDTSPGRGYA